MKIKIAIVGYGNLGKACERIAVECDNFDCVGIFTRRNPQDIRSPFEINIYHIDDIFKFVGKIDVVVMCLGSANDLMPCALKLAPYFNTIDSFDTHAKMCGYINSLEKLTTYSKTLSFVGIGWDPGLFSLIRALSSCVLPNGNTHTFWGKGVSQGHSEAIRRIAGVVDAKQYTIPIDAAIVKARKGDGKMLCARDMHRRECYVVARDDANKKDIETQIKSMPNYFADYDTTVHFVDHDTLKNECGGMEHSGIVLRVGKTNDTTSVIEFDLKLDSNPNFTASVLMAYAKANVKMHAKGEYGVKTILDIPISQLCDGSIFESVKRFV